MQIVAEEEQEEKTIVREIPELHERRGIGRQKQKGAAEAAPFRKTEQIYLPEVEAAEVAG